MVQMSERFHTISLGLTKLDVPLGHRFFIFPIFIDQHSIAKQRDNALGSVCLSIRLSVCSPSHSWTVLQSAANSDTPKIWIHLPNDTKWPCYPSDTISSSTLHYTVATSSITKQHFNSQYNTQTISFCNKLAFPVRVVYKSQKCQVHVIWHTSIYW